MNKNNCSFEVADVPLASAPFPKSPARHAIFDLLARDFRTSTVLFWEYPTASRGIARRFHSAPIEGPGIEACSGEDRLMMTGVSFHPLVYAAHASFCFHYPLTFSPDMIWLLIVQGVAEHINASAGKLRKQFVQHQGAIVINVRRDDLQRGLPDQPWREVIAEFAGRIRDHIGESTSDLFVPRFSTTGEDERTACQVALMYGLGQYFELNLMTVCGIPRINLEGRPEDWCLLAERVSAFRRFDLDWWIDPLELVLRQFAFASEGQVNRPFWNSLYKMRSQSGGAAYSGWLGIFFPYLRDKGGNTSRNPLLPQLADYLSEFSHGSDNSQKVDSRAPFPQPWNLPKGITSVPFKWEYHFQEFPMEFLGGFVGVGQDPENLSLRPEIGWVVRDKPRAGSARGGDDSGIGVYRTVSPAPPASSPPGPGAGGPRATLLAPLSKGLRRLTSLVLK